MPTAAAEANESEAAPMADATQSAAPVAEPNAATPVTVPSANVAGAAPMAASVPAPPAIVKAAPSPAAAIVSGTVPHENVELVNIMELLVNERIDAALEKFRCCTCDKCKKDVTAITLNKLVPCYIVSSDETKRTDAESKFAGQVATGLVQAILTVKARPTHE